MNKVISLFFSLPFFIVAPGAVLASEAAPVQIVGVHPSSENASVDSALNDSVAAESSVEKPQKYSRPFSSHHTVKASIETPEEAVIAEHPASSDDYTIRAGDVLQITVWKEENLDREVLVLPDGTIDFPLIGSFNAQGLTPGQLRTIIKAKLHSLIPGASVAVLVKATLGHSVSIIGQVNKPGEIIMGHHLTVMQALSQAGGLTPYASEGSIEILRTVNGKETAIEFPYGDVAEGESLDKDITLNPGDVVVVPTASLF